MKTNEAYHGAHEFEACPTCGVPRIEWPDAGLVENGTAYCSRDCAEGLVAGCKSHGIPRLIEEYRTN